MSDYRNKKIWIIGVNEEFNEALIKEFLDKGARVAFSTKSHEQKAPISDEYISRVDFFPLDIKNFDNVYETGQQVKNELGTIDTAIFLLDRNHSGKMRDLDKSYLREFTDINLVGAYHFSQAVLPILRYQQHGQIVFSGGVAGYCPLPNNQPYAAVQAAIINMAQTLHMEESDIDVRLINTGYDLEPSKNTPAILRNNLYITTECAAEKIVNGLEKPYFHTGFPLLMRILMFFGRLLPDTLYLKCAPWFWKKFRS